MNLTFSILFYLLGGLFKCGSGSATLLLIYSIFINFNFIVWISSDPEPDPEPDPNKANKFLEPDPNTVPGVLWYWFSNLNHFRIWRSFIKYVGLKKFTTIIKYL